MYTKHITYGHKQKGISTHFTKLINYLTLMGYKCK